MQRVLLLSLFVTLSLSCAGGGPVVSPCIFKAGESPRGVCVDGYTDQVSFKELPELNNFVCFSPDDTAKILRALKRASPRVYNQVGWRYSTFFDLKNSR